MIYPCKKCGSDKIDVLSHHHTAIDGVSEYEVLSSLKCQKCGGVATVKGKYVLYATEINEISQYD